MQPDGVVVDNYASTSAHPVSVFYTVLLSLSISTIVLIHIFCALQTLVDATVATTSSSLFINDAS